MYSAGASKGGRLGCGWTKKTYVYNPAAVVTHWANLGDITFDNAGGMQGQSAMAGGGIDGLDDTIPGAGTPGEELRNANQVRIQRRTRRRRSTDEEEDE